MCFSTGEAREMVDAADAAGVALMVGYPKRYDPAFARFKDEVAALDGPRLLRVTTTESPFVPYVGHYPLMPAGDRRRRRGAGRAARRRAVAPRRGDRHRRRVAGGPVLQRAARHPGARDQHHARRPGRARPARVRRDAPRRADGRPGLRRRDRGHPLGRRARDDPLLDGVHRDGRGRARDADLPLAVPAQRADDAQRRGRARRRGRVVAARRGHLLRERLQARARRLPRRGHHRRARADRRRATPGATSRSARRSSAAWSRAPRSTVPSDY